MVLTKKCINQDKIDRHGILFFYEFVYRCIIVCYIIYFILRHVKLKSTFNTLRKYLNKYNHNVTEKVFLTGITPSIIIQADVKLVRSVEVPSMDLKLFIHVPIQTIILIYTIYFVCSYKNQLYRLVFLTRYWNATWTW